MGIRAALDVSEKKYLVALRHGKNPGAHRIEGPRTDLNVVEIRMHLALSGFRTPCSLVQNVYHGR